MADLLDVDDAPADVVDIATVYVVDDNLAAAGSPDGRGHVVHRCLDARPDVEDFAFGSRVRGRQEGRVDGVLDEREVASLAAVAVDAQALPGVGRDEELRHDSAVRVLRALVRPVDVGVSDHGDRQAVTLVERHAVMLAGELADCVGRQRDETVVLVDRDRAWVAVDGCGRRIHNSLGVELARSKQHVQGAADVGLEVVARVCGRRDDVSGGQVKDERMPLHEVEYERLIGN